MRPIAIVQHEPSVPPGTIARVFVEDGIDHLIVEAWADPLWPDWDELAGLVVLGGTMNVDQTTEYPFLKQSAALMAEAVANGVPTLGVCLGSQMLARVLGEDVRRADVRNAGFSPLTRTPKGEDDPLLAAFPDDVSVLQFHEDTFSAPANAEVLATSSTSGLVQAIRYGRSAYGIQFHFEVTPDILREWCRNIGPESLGKDWGTSEEELGRQAHESLGAQAEAGKKLVRRFLEMVEAPSGV